MPLSHILRKSTVGYKPGKVQEKISHLMYKDDIKLYAKNVQGWHKTIRKKLKKELENLIHTVRIYSQNIGMEFSIEKRDMTHRMELPNPERSQKMKSTNTWVSWRLTPSNKCKWKIRPEKNISGELENYSRQNSPAETTSKE